MWRTISRCFTEHKVLRGLNRELRCKEAKELYLSLSLKSEKEKQLCKEQYLYSLKILELLSEDPVPKVENTFQKPLVIKSVSNSRTTYLEFTENVIILTILAFMLHSFIGKSGVQDSILNLLSSNSHIHLVQKSKTRFSDVKGIDDCKEEVEEIVNYLKNPAKYKKAGAKLGKGVLLTGRPGTGKTLLAKAIAGEAGCKFFSCSGSEFDELFVGLGAKRVRSLFEEAKNNSPCIVFIDEIDALARTRKFGDESQSLNQLLIEMDGFSPMDQVVVIAATNFPEMLDEALKRSGRFDKEISIPVPDLKGRTEIISLYLKKIKCADEVLAHDIAKKTSGMTGADLENIVNLAALNAVKEGRKTCIGEDFEVAVDRVVIGLSVRSYTMTEQEKECTVYHELGHAVVGFFTEGAGELHKVTILPRGRSLGHTSLFQKENAHSVSVKEALATIDVCMGGRAAEEIFFGTENITTGCSSDLKSATNYVYQAVKSGIFTETTGFLSFNDKKDLGESQRNHLDNTVSLILDASYARAKLLIQEKTQIIEKLAEVLREKETLNQEEFAKIANNT